MRTHKRHIQALGAWLLALTQVFFACGCRQSTGGSSGGGGGFASTAAGASAGVDMGQIVYDLLHHQYETAGQTAKAQALEGRRADFIGAVNRILPSDVSSNLFPTLKSLLVLVDDGSVEAAVEDVDGMIVDLLADQGALDALAKLMGGTSTPAKKGADHTTNVLISRLLAYPELEQVAKAIFELVRDNDGVDAAGQPNGEKNLLGQLQGLLSRQLQAFQPQATTGQQVGTTLEKLADALLADKPLKSFPDLGAPAWAVRLDKHGNPKVKADAATGKLPTPFIDKNNDGAADVNVANEPIDSAGAPIVITAFGKDGARDSSNRALAPGGGLYYEYFDAKRTLISEVLLLAGELLGKDVTGNVVAVMEGLTDRVKNNNGTADPSDDYETISPDCPLLDANFASMEMVKRTSLCELLHGLAAVVKADPVKFGQMVDDLVVAISKARKAAVTVPATAGAGTRMLNDLLPMLEAALQPRQGSTSAVRALLQAFNSEQKRLRNLPASFALMMKYHDYRNRVLAGPGKPSVMQRVLKMMEAANGCNVLGGNPSNMADFYLAAMAGNAEVIGINISIGTINTLVNNSLIRNLLCSAITPSDVNALKDFNDTGALEAMKPICRVFQQKGQITLLKNIMLGLGRHYDAAMRPTEPTAVAVLESGGVERLFEALDAMTTVRVPGSNEVVADVVADVLGQMVDSSTTIYDRRNRPNRTLMHLMLSGMDGIEAKAVQKNIKPHLDALATAAGDVLLQTFNDAGKERWKWTALKDSLGDVISGLADAMPRPAADRATWAADSQKSMQDLITHRDTVVALDVLHTVWASAQKPVMTAAVRNLFTPKPSVKDDAFGAILGLLADKLAHRPSATQVANTVSSIDQQALATVLHFFGKQLEPSKNHFDGVLKLIRGLIAADDGLLVLRLARNAFDMGPNGTDDPPAQILSSVFDDVGKAGGPTTATTSQSLRESLEKARTFIHDQAEGLPSFLARIKARAK